MAVVMKRYVFIYTPGQECKKNSPLHYQELQHHAEYMNHLLQRSRLVARGPFSDGKGDLAIVLAQNLTDAQSILYADPCVAQEIFSATLHPWQLAFERTCTPEFSN